ncbi:MAG: 3-phosphoshikimate 1-carboxyvinyltransferase [Candidatus Omnitrophota bacterium]
MLCGQKFPSCFKALPALAKRPMARITKPLRIMGADIKGKKIKSQEYAPLIINPSKELRGINYKLPIASAQIKSAILFASLYARGKTQITEINPCRDHSERMLSLFGARVKRKKGVIISYPAAELTSPGNIFVPSDFSSAAFFIVLGLILKDSKILIKNINLNPTRCGLLSALKRMGANIKIINKKNYFEPYGDILVKSSCLRGINISKEEIPLMIDEVPILCAAASFAKGTTIISGIKELKVKETDRINSMVYNLKQAGVKISSIKYFENRESNWLIKIQAPQKLKTAKFKSFSDHRTAMSLIIAGTASGEEYTIDDVNCINKSFPQFITLLESLKRE